MKKRKASIADGPMAIVAAAVGGRRSGRMRSARKRVQPLTDAIGKIDLGSLPLNVLPDRKKRRKARKRKNRKRGQLFRLATNAATIVSAAEVATDLLAEVRRLSEIRSNGGRVDNEQDDVDNEQDDVDNEQDDVDDEQDDVHDEEGGRAGAEKDPDSEAGDRAGAEHNGVGKRVRNGKKAADADEDEEVANEKVRRG